MHDGSDHLSRLAWFSSGAHSGHSLLCGNAAPVSATRTAGKPLSKEEVIVLLRQAARDSDAANKRARMQSDRVAPWKRRSTASLYDKYPVSYAKQRLVLKGRTIIPLLLQVLRESDCKDVHVIAWELLSQLDGALCLHELHQAGLENRLSPSVVSLLLRSWFPVRTQAAFLEPDKTLEWLGGELREKSYDQILLTLLDEFLKAEYADGGLDPRVPDERILRWLNRVYDLDLDCWLAANAPEALRFRQRELLKGYDPATSLDLGQSIFDGMLEQALAVLYSSPDERRACRQLLEAVYPNVSAQKLVRPTPTEGWLGRLRDWYWGQRDSLRYDRTVLRLSTGPAATQVGS